MKRLLPILVLAALLALVVRLPLLGADPDWSRRFDLAVEVDAGLYAATAHDRALGAAVDPRGPHFEVPLHTWLVGLGLRWDHGLRGLRLPGLLLGVLAVVATGALAWCLRGAAAAAVAAALAAVSVPGVDADLAATPYVLVRLGVLASFLALALAARRERPGARAALAGGGLLLLGASAGVRPAALLAAPGVVVGGAGVLLGRWPRRREVLVGGLLALGLGGVLLLVPALRAEALKHVGDLAPARVAARGLGLGQDTGLVVFALGSFLLWGLALATRPGTAEEGGGAAPPRVRAVEVGLHALALGALGALCLLDYAPPRYVLFLYPALAVLAGVALSDLRRGAVVGRGLGRWRLGLVVGVAAWLAHQLLFGLLLAGLLTGAAPPTWAGLLGGPLHLALTALLVGAVVALARARPDGATWRRIAVSTLAVGLALDGLLLAGSLIRPTRHLEREAAALDRLLPAEACLGESLGATFGLLTRRPAVRLFGAPTRRGFEPLLESAGVTHLVIPEPHRRRLTEHHLPLLDLVWRGQVRGIPYRVYRVRPTVAGVPPTPLERSCLLAARLRAMRRVALPRP